MLDQLRRTVPSGVVATCSGRGSIDLIADDAPDWPRARADDVAASNSEAGVRAYVERLLDDLNEVGLQAFVQ